MRKLLFNVKSMHDRLLKLSFLAVGLLMCITLHAQNVTVRGVVKDASDTPLPGVIVQEDGNVRTAVVTNERGEFTFQASNSNAVINVSMTGFAAQQLSISGRTFFEITMSDESIALNEVVVTALGIRRQAKSLGYSVSEVSNESLTAGRESNMIQALSGKVPGVDISTSAGGPSGSTRVVIRGATKLTGTNMPLYVVDGVPMDNTQLGSANQDGGYDFGDGLTAINPDDIASISVLKGGAASALYGQRGQNGVVLITTKSAKKGAGLGVDFSTSFNMVQIGRSFDDYQREYGQGRNGMLITEVANASSSTQSAWGAKLDPSLSIPIYNGQIKPYSNVNNNIMSFFRLGWTATNTVALSKASETVDFRLSISDMRNADIVPKSDMSRTTFMFKGGAKLHEKVRVEARANYTREIVNNRPALSDSPNNIGNALIGLAPNFDQSWLATDYKDIYGRYNEWNGNEWRLNPYWVINEMSNETTRDRIMGHLQLNYDITSFLSLQAKAGTDFYNFRMSMYAPRYTPQNMAGSLTERTTRVGENNYEAMLRYHQTFGDFDISGFFGGNIMQWSNETITNRGGGQVIDGIKDIKNYTDLVVDRYYPRLQINSLFASVNFGYKDIVYVDATWRGDWDSSLYKENRQYNYPSVSASFVFSSLLNTQNSALSFGKLRSSWAKTGSGTDPYSLSLEYGLRDFTLNGNPLGQITSDSAPYLMLKPTSTYSFEIGTDLRFFKDRLRVDLGYYYTSSVDQIMRMPISAVNGYTNKTINAGKITNQGFEAVISGIPVRTPEFEWETTLNMSKNVNKVVRLHPEAPNYQLAEARWAGAAIYAMEGSAYGVIMGKKFNRAPDGNIIMENGLPTYSSNMEILGSGTYDFLMGFGNNFRYKNLNLGVLFDMKFGADIYSMTAMQAHTNGTSKNTLEGRKEWYESEEARMAQGVAPGSWTPTGGYVAKGVIAVTDGAGNVTYRPNDVYIDPQSYWANVYNNTPEPYIYDASYIKLRELSLSYRLPSSALGKSGIKELSISLFARNLWLIYSNIPNIDPESNYNNGNAQGFEYGSLPTRRTYGISVGIKF